MITRRGFAAGLAVMASGLGLKWAVAKPATDFTFGSVLRDSPDALPHPDRCTWNRQYVHVYLDGERVTDEHLMRRMCVEADATQGYVIFKDVHSRKQFRRNGRVQILFQTPEKRKEYMERYGKHDGRFLA